MARSAARDQLGRSCGQRLRFLRSMRARLPALVELLGELPQLRAFGVGGDIRRARRCASVRCERRLTSDSRCAASLQPAASAAPLRASDAIAQHARLDPHALRPGRRRSRHIRGCHQSKASAVRLSRANPRFTVIYDRYGVMRRRECNVGYTLQNRQAGGENASSMPAAGDRPPDLNMTAAGCCTTWRHCKATSDRNSATSAPRRRSSLCRCRSRDLVAGGHAARRAVHRAVERAHHHRARRAAGRRRRSRRRSRRRRRPPRCSSCGSCAANFLSQFAMEQALAQPAAGGVVSNGALPRRLSDALDLE